MTAGLQNARERGMQGESDQDERPNGLRDMLVTSHTPTLGSGRAMRTYGLVRALAQHRDLDVLYARFEGPEPDAHFRAVPRVSWQSATPARGLGRAISYGRHRISGMPAPLARGASPELVKAARDLADSPRRGRVIADGPTAALALLDLARRRPVIYNAHNLESSFRHELDGARPADRRALLRFERQVLQRFHETWMVSAADIAGAREICPGARLRYVPNVVDVTAIHPHRQPSPERRALFVASFSYEPNRAGLQFLLQDVMPEVWESIPDAKLTLVGSGLDRAPSADPRVETLGFVEDLQDVYGRSTCALAPMTHGGGTPLKLVEALAYELPVVSTTRAAAGLEVRSGEHCLLADGRHDFAQALISVLRDGAPAMGSKGRELAQRLYSIEALTQLVAP